MFQNKGGTVDVIPFTLKLLQWLGLRGSRGHRAMFYLAWIWATVVVAIPKMFHRYQMQEEFTVCNVAEFLFQFSIEFKVMIFACNMTYFNQLVEIVRGIYCRVRTVTRHSPTEQMIEEANHRIDKRSKAYFLYMISIVSLFTLIPFSQSGFSFFMNMRNHTEKVEYKTFMKQGFYGLDIKGNYGHYIIYAISAGIAHYISAAMFAANDIIMFSSIFCTILIFKLVSIKLKKIEELSRKDMIEELTEIIEIHVDGLRCIKLLENFANLAMMVQMACWALAWVSLVLCLNDGLSLKALNVIIMILAITIETYALCDLGIQLTDESLAVANAMYDCQWYKLPTDVQKSLSLLLQRAQKREGISAAKFFYMNREKFAGVAQASYSCYLVLKERL